MIGNMLFTLLVMTPVGAIILGVAVSRRRAHLAALQRGAGDFPYWDDFAKIDYHRASAAEGTVARLKMKYVNSQFQFYQTLTSAGSMLLLSSSAPTSPSSPPSRRTTRSRSERVVVKGPCLDTILYGAPLRASPSLSPSGACPT